MSWTTLTTADLLARLSESERQTLEEKDLAEGQTSPVTAILSQVTGMVRRAVGKGGGTLGLAGTIPDELISAAISIARYQLCCRFPTQLLNEHRVKEYDNAIAELKDVADDAAGIAAPATATSDTIEAESITPSIGDDPPRGTRYFDRDLQDGI